MITFYFTATGNSLYVAKSIGGELCSIPRMLQEGRREFAADAIGFVFPCHGFGLPRMVNTFLRESHFTAGYHFAVMTFGNLAAGGLDGLAAAGRQAGIRFDYTAEILMVDNYLPLFRMEDQLKKEPAKKIEENLARIVSDIAARRGRLTRKSFAVSAVSRAVNRLFLKKQLDGGDKGFLVGDDCNGCRVCAQVCPAGNIDVAGKPRFRHKCEGCYACIHHCPRNAVHLKSERSAARFINRHVTLSEIIAANNQPPT